LQGWALPEQFLQLRRLLEARMGVRGKREFIVKGFVDEVVIICAGEDIAALTLAFQRSRSAPRRSFAPGHG